MKGYRFYEEFDNSYKKRMKRGSGNVLALDLDDRGRPYFSIDGCFECTAAILSEADSPVCGTRVNWVVLRRNYRRITEEARPTNPPGNVCLFGFL